MSEANQSKPAAPSGGANLPWWRYPIVWLVVGGPLAVVVASLFTVGVAVRNVDPVLDTSPKGEVSLKDRPAVQARNHALDASRKEPAH